MKIEIYEESIDESNEDDDKQSIQIKLAPDKVLRAKKLDVSPLEIIDEEKWDVGTELHGYHTPESARNAAKFQSQQLRNIAQLLPWQKNNIPAQLQKEIIGFLQNIKKNLPDSTCSAAFLLGSIAAGRPISSVITGLRIKGTHTLEEYFEVKTNVLVIDESQKAIAIRVNPPDLVNQDQPIGARPIRHYLLIPDYFGLCNGFCSLIDQIQSPLEGLSALTSMNIKSRCNALIQALRNEFGIGESQIWQMLPRAMQLDAGMHTACALITGWTTLNSAVDRHYFTPSAADIQARYQSAFQYMASTYDTSKFLPAPKQDGFIGAPGCPSDQVLSKLIAGFKKQFQLVREPNDKHNLLTLYTLMLCTVGFGLRHSLDPDFEVNCYDENDHYALLTFAEKGSHRALVVPNIVYQQLIIQRKRAELMRSLVWLRDHTKVVQGSFFWINDSGVRMPIQPTKISEYLSVCNIEFAFPLNSLRRLMFTRSFELGIRGPQTDFFGGHGVAGRHPFVSESGIDIGIMEDFANELNDVLISDGWTVFGDDL